MGVVGLADEETPNCDTEDACASDMASKISLIDRTTLSWTTALHDARSVRNACKNVNIALDREVVYSTLGEWKSWKSVDDVSQ